MRSEIQKCLRKLDTAFQHVWNLYNAITNGLTRVATKGSVLSTSTTLTARIKLVSWLKHREDTWRLSRQRKPVKTVSFMALIWHITHSSLSGHFSRFGWAGRQ
jgi:hypothetical protein